LRKARHGGKNDLLKGRSSTRGKKAALLFLIPIDMIDMIDFKTVQNEKSLWFVMNHK